MAAEIIEFPERGRDRLVSSIARLETIVGEVERIVADEPEAGVDRLLAIMERMGDQLVDLASLVLDEGSKLHPLGTLWNAVERPIIRAAIAVTRERAAEAIELLQSAKPYDRAFPEAVYLRGLAYLRLGKAPEAQAEFRKILDHKGANWGLIYALAARSQTKPPGSAQNSQAQE